MHYIYIWYGASRGATPLIYMYIYIYYIFFLYVDFIWLMLLVRDRGTKLIFFLIRSNKRKLNEYLKKKSKIISYLLNYFLELTYINLLRVGNSFFPQCGISCAHIRILFQLVRVLR